MERLVVNPNYVSFNIPNTDSYRSSSPTNNNLPPDWIELEEPITKKKYYVCLTTKHTQWLNPTIPIGTMMSNGLPYGWEKEYDVTSKRFYYINHVGRFNTWNPPIKQRGY